MADIEKIWITPPLPGGIKVRHVGFLDLKEFYTWMQRWFEFEGYFKSGKDFERFYEERTLPKGKELHIRWVGKKKVNEYFNYGIEVIWLLIGLNEVEVPRGDKKIKIFKGDFELRIGAYLEKGMGARNIFRKIYDQFVIRRLILDHRDKLYEKTYSLQAAIKAYFDQYVG